MRARQTTLRSLIAGARLKDESRNAQATRMGFSEGSLRLYESGALPHNNTIPALARALRMPEAKLRKMVDRERAARQHDADGAAATPDATATIPAVEAGP